MLMVERKNHLENQEEKKEENIYSSGNDFR